MCHFSGDLLSSLVPYKHTSTETLKELSKDKSDDAISVYFNPLMMLIDWKKSPIMED
jgi:hypothetical protein